MLVYSTMFNGIATLINAGSLAQVVTADGCETISYPAAGSYIFSLMMVSWVCYKYAG